MMAGGERRQARHEQHQGDADNDKSRHDLVVLHRLAGVRPRCPRVVYGILRALHRYSSLEIPLPAKYWADSTVELPEAIVWGTVAGIVAGPTPQWSANSRMAVRWFGVDQPPKTEGPPSAGMLIASTTSIKVNSTQPAPCHAHHVSRLRRVWYVRTNAHSAPISRMAGAP